MTELALTETKSLSGSYLSTEETISICAMEVISDTDCVSGSEDVEPAELSELAPMSPTSGYLETVHTGHASCKVMLSHCGNEAGARLSRLS